MNYTQLPPNYKNDTIAEAIYARELEYFHYDFDRCNFAYLLTVTTDVAYRDDLQKRLDSTAVQMGNVQRIIEALHAQITDPEDYQAAVHRTAEKRKANDALRTSSK